MSILCWVLFFLFKDLIIDIFLNKKCDERDKKREKEREREREREKERRKERESKLDRMFKSLPETILYRRQILAYGCINKVSEGSE